VRKIKIAAHSEKEYIFSGEETLSYGLKGKYITHGYSVIFSPGVKSNHRPHSTLSAKAQIPKFQGQIQGIFTCHSHIPGQLPSSAHLPGLRCTFRSPGPNSKIPLPVLKN
jgi:hypothetical protein